MSRLAYNHHRLFAGLILLLTLFAAADYYLDLGFLGRRVANGLLILAIGTMAIYGSFFSPMRQDMRAHKEARKAENDL